MSAYGHTPFAPTYRHDTIFQWVDNVTFVRGKHTLKPEPTSEWVRADLFQTGNPVGEFDFDGEVHKWSERGGLGLASILLGYPETVTRAAIDTLPFRRTTAALLLCARTTSESIAS